MAIAITHPFVSGIADGADATVVRPSNWNATHTLTGLGTGVETALGINTGSDGSVVLFNGAGGTPSGLTLTNATGLPVAGGGTGIAATTAYSVVFSGTTATGAFQAAAGPGTSGHVLTSNGAGALPTFQASATGNSSRANANADLTVTGSAQDVSGATLSLAAGTWIITGIFDVTRQGVTNDRAFTGLLDVGGTDENDVAYWEPLVAVTARETIVQMWRVVLGSTTTCKLQAIYTGGTTGDFQVNDENTAIVAYQSGSGSGDVIGDDTSTTVQNIVAYNATGGKNITELTGTQGDVLYHNGTNWAKLGAGTNGHFLKTQGAGANPAWAAASGGSSDIIFADAPNQDFDLTNGGAGGAVTIISKSVTGIVAKDSIVIDAYFTLVNNSGSARTYTHSHTLGSMTATAADGATIAASANRSNRQFMVQFSVSATNLAFVLVQPINFAAAAADAAGAAAQAYGIWDSSTSDLTGTQTVSWTVSSSATTTTQTLTLHSYVIRKVSQL